MKTLIIEDDPNIYELIKLYIEKAGFHAIGAENGDEGLAKYFDEKSGFYHSRYYASGNEWVGSL